MTEPRDPFADQPAGDAEPSENAIPSGWPFGPESESEPDAAETPLADDPLATAADDPFVVPEADAAAPVDPAPTELFPAAYPSAAAPFPGESASTEIFAVSDGAVQPEVPPAPLSRREARAAAEASGVGRGGSSGDDAPAAAAAAAGGGSGGGGDKPSGLLGAIARHPQAWLFSALAVLFVLLGTGAVFAGISVGSPSAAAAPDVKTSSSPKATTPPPRPVPGSTAAATRLRTCSIAGPAADPRLATFEGSVINAKTGEVLFDRAAGTPAATASVMKTVIAATALVTIGGDYRMSTRVYAGATPDTIVLVGGGDPTLSALPAGTESVYAGAPKLSDLAAQVKQALGADFSSVTKIVLDSTMWNNSDAWDPSWPANERTLGYQPLIVPLMVDGDRANPRAQTSPRSTEPIQNAGNAFRDALGLGSVEFSSGAVAGNARLLGEVKSQPVKTLIGQMLPNSDNTLAEMIARVTSKVVGRDGSAASLTPVVASALATLKVDAPGLAIKDGSGESKNDAVAPVTIAQLMSKVLAGGNGMDAIYSALPVSGKTGTLAGRFTGANAVARGAVNAKTGSIANTYTLGGIVHAKDGTALSFAFFSIGSGSSAMAAIDTVTTAVFNCGDNLTNN